jgi:hypothetical protein
MQVRRRTGILSGGEPVRHVWRPTRFVRVLIAARWPLRLMRARRSCGRRSWRGTVWRVGILRLRWCSIGSSSAGASRDYQQDGPWKQLERIRWLDAVASTLLVAETQICTSVASSRADILDPACFVTSAPHFGSSNTHHAMLLATLLWSNSDLLRTDAMAVRSRRRCLCGRDQRVGRSLACRVIAA